VSDKMNILNLEESPKGGSFFVQFIQRFSEKIMQIILNLVLKAS